MPTINDLYEIKNRNEENNFSRYCALLSNLSINDYGLSDKLLLNPHKRPPILDQYLPKKTQHISKNNNHHKKPQKSKNHNKHKRVKSGITKQLEIFAKNKIKNENIIDQNLIQNDNIDTIDLINIAYSNSKDTPQSVLNAEGFMEADTSATVINTIKAEYDPNWAIQQLLHAKSVDRRDRYKLHNNKSQRKTSMNDIIIDTEIIETSTATDNIAFEIPTYAKKYNSDDEQKSSGDTDITSKFLSPNTSASLDSSNSALNNYISPHSSLTSTPNPKRMKKLNYQLRKRKLSVDSLRDSKKYKEKLRQLHLKKPKPIDLRQFKKKPINNNTNNVTNIANKMLTSTHATNIVKAFQNGITRTTSLNNLSEYNNNNNNNSMSNNNNNVNGYRKRGSINEDSNHSTTYNAEPTSIPLNNGNTIINDHFGHSPSKSRSNMDINNNIECINGNYNPYYEACQEIKKIKSFITPEDKLHCIVNTIEIMRCKIDEYYDKRCIKKIVLTPDDLLSLISYIIIQSNVDKFLSEIEFIDDFVVDNLKMDMPGYYLATIHACVKLIVNDELGLHNKCQTNNININNIN